MTKRHYLDLRQPSAPAGEQPAPDSASTGPRDRASHQRARRARQSEDWWTVQDVMEHFQVSETTVGRMIRGEGCYAPLRAFRFGVHWRFLPSDVAAWETQHMRAYGSRPRPSTARSKKRVEAAGVRGQSEAPAGAIGGSPQPGTAVTAPGPDGRSTSSV